MAETSSPVPCGLPSLPPEHREAYLQHLVHELQRGEGEEALPSPEPTAEGRIERGSDEGGQHDEEDGHASFISKQPAKAVSEGEKDRAHRRRGDETYDEGGGGQRVLAADVAACGAFRDFAREHGGRSRREGEEEQQDAERDLIETHRLRPEGARHPDLEKEGEEPGRHRKNRHNRECLDRTVQFFASNLRYAPRAEKILPEGGGADAGRAAEMGVRGSRAEKKRA